MLELDHVFVFATAGGAEADELVVCGLAEGRSNRHVGQGTQNRCFFFRNAYLEVLWVCDDDEAHSPIVAPTRLWERSRFRTTGVAPFGVCVRPASPLPFPTFPYRPSYMPEGAQIDVAETLRHEPLVFATPWGARPDAAPPDRRQPLEHPSGAAEITGLRITLPGDAPPSAPLRALQDAGIVTLAHGDAHLAELELDHGRAGLRIDLRPALPLVLRP